MAAKILKAVDISIFYIFLGIAIITPLIFTTQTTELYEVPKMFFVYFAATLVFLLTLIKVIVLKKILIPKSPVVVAFAVFVTIQVVSTLFSIDKFTSVFGYPTRLNGGVLSQLAYFILFTTALINLNFEKSQKILIAIAATGLAVALLGIPGHFGRDPSCLILTGELTSGCWQEGFDPQKRIFSTLGQPNWLASFLVLTIPLILGFGLKFGPKFAKVFLNISANLQFLALIFTASRAGLLGIGLSLVAFLAILGRQNILKHKIYLTITFLTFLSLYLIFGTNLTKRTLEPIAKYQIPLSQQVESSQPTNLSGESAKIRLIVWQGSFDIFKNWPVLGTGPETFVSSYYMFRPTTHNDTAEWEYFYNKAHNEFLNYLANTGGLGFISYLVFIFFALFNLFALSKNSQNLIAKASLASVLGYFLTIFFGFSTVATQTTFFIILAANLSQSSKSNTFSLNLSFFKEAYITPLLVLASILALLALSFILRLFFADIFERRAQNLSENPIRVFNAYQNAIKAHPSQNPYLLADFSYTISTYLEDLEEKDAGFLAERADLLARNAQSLSPNNYLIAQKVAKTYILLAGFSPGYWEKAQSLAAKLTDLAPTYPPAYLTAAKTQIVTEDQNAAAKSLEKALELKPDYLEARQLLEQLTTDN